MRRNKFTIKPNVVPTPKVPITNFVAEKEILSVPVNTQNDSLKPNLNTTKISYSKSTDITVSNHIIAAKCLLSSNDLRTKHNFNIPLKDTENNPNLTIKDLVFNNPSANPMSESNKKHALDSTNNNEVKETNVAEKKTTSLAPRVKIGPDGNIILDTESLIVKHPENPSTFTSPLVEECYDPFGYLKHHKKYGTPHKIWSNAETKEFYRSLAKHGINLSAIGEDFPNRQRIEIKNKYKREERANHHLVDVALAQHPKLDHYLNLLFPEKSQVKKSSTQPLRDLGNRIVESLDSNLVEPSHNFPGYPIESTKKRAKLLSQKNAAKTLISLRRYKLTSTNNPKKKMNENTTEMINNVVFIPPPLVRSARLREKRKRRMANQTIASDDEEDSSMFEGEMTSTTVSECDTMSDITSIAGEDHHNNPNNNSNNDRNNLEIRCPPPQYLEQPNDYDYQNACYSSQDMIIKNENIIITDAGNYVSYDLIPNNSFTQPACEIEVESVDIS